MTVALTGSTGLIGSAVRSMFEASDAVRTIGRRPPVDQIADLVDPDAVHALDLSGCETLVHCAGIVDEDFVNADRAFRQATVGMAALVAQAKAAGVKQFVYISSAHVYGPLRGTLDETSPPNPLHDYAICHFASEQILRRASSLDFCGAVLRPCAVFGLPPQMEMFRRWRLIPFGFARDAIRNGAIVLASSGAQRRNFVGAQDVARAIDTWRRENVDAFTLINPVGKETMTVLSFAELCQELAEQITGRRCIIQRQDTSDKIPDDFEYRTRDVRFIGHSDLRQNTERLMRDVEQFADIGALVGN